MNYAIQTKTLKYKPTFSPMRLTKIDSEYTRPLNHLKDAMTDGSEWRIVRALLRDLVDEKQIRLLDIGTGDGRFLEKILTSLSNDDRVSITLLEPLATMGSYELDQLRVRFPNAEIIAKTFLDFEVQEKFDFILSSQSIYYLGELNAVFGKLRGLAAPGCNCVISIWSENCVLYNLGVFYGKNKRPLSAERFLKLIQEKEFGEGIHIKSSHNFRGGLDSAKVIDWPPEIKLDALELITRTGFDQNKEKVADLVKDYASGVDLNSDRINNTFCLLFS